MINWILEKQDAILGITAVALSVIFLFVWLKGVRMNREEILKNSNG